MNAVGFVACGILFRENFRRHLHTDSLTAKILYSEGQPLQRTIPPNMFAPRYVAREERKRDRGLAVASPECQ
jgi:hypothetical protein